MGRTLCGNIACVDLNSSPQNCGSCFHFCSFGEVWQAGVLPDWSALYAGERRQRQSLPGYAFARKRHWVAPDEDWRDVSFFRLTTSDSL